jgi:hypothetical protein
MERWNEGKMERRKDGMKERSKEGMKKGMIKLAASLFHNY